MSLAVSLVALVEVLVVEVIVLVAYAIINVGVCRAVSVGSLLGSLGLPVHQFLAIARQSVAVTKHIGKGEAT